MSDELAAFTLKVVFQDPSNGYDDNGGREVNNHLNLDDIDRLTESCVSMLVSDSGPLMETVRMQVSYFTYVYLVYV